MGRYLALTLRNVQSVVVEMRTELCLWDVRGRLHEHSSQQAFPDGCVVGEDQCLDTARAYAAHFYVFRAASNGKTEALINAYDVRT